jgi:TolB-like protein
VVAVLALGAVTLRARVTSSDPPPSAVQEAAIIPSVGVLPFTNRSDSREMEYFSDGVTDELITTLSRVAGLQVAGRTSSFSLKSKGLSAQQSAETLHVKLLIDGSVRSSGPSVRVTWDLIDGVSGRILNSGDFDGQMRNVIALQDSLARAIVAQLRPALGVSVRASAPRHSTNNFEAYNLYLQGHYYWNQRTPASMRRGISYFNDAIARDSGYALAWAELSSAYTLEAGFGDMRPNEVRELARVAGERAVHLDSTLSEGFTALGIWHSLANQDWATALRYMDRAVALDSTSSFPRLFRTWPLLALGRGDEALAEVRKAVALDPLAPTQNARLGAVLTCLRRYDEAIAELRRALQVDPSNVQARFELGHAYAMKGQFEDAFKAFPDAIEAQAGYSTGWLAASLGRAGRRQEARAIYDRLLALSHRRPVTYEALALAALGAGDTPLALDWLERGVRDHSFYLVFLNDDPLFDPLRSEARFAAILRQLRFPERRGAPATQ